MKLLHKFIIPVPPKSVQMGARARISGRRLVWFNDAAKEKYLSEIAAELKAIGPALPHECPLGVVYRFYMERPKNANKKHRTTGAVAHWGFAGPDITNLLKGTEDGITKGRVWRDDGQVVWEFGIKMLCEDDLFPRTEVEVYQLDKDETTNPHKLKHLWTPDITMKRETSIYGFKPKLLCDEEAERLTSKQVAVVLRNLAKGELTKEYWDRCVTSIDDGLMECRFSGYYLIFMVSRKMPRQCVVCQTPKGKEYHIQWKPPGEFLLDQGPFSHLTPEEIASITKHLIDDSQDPRIGVRVRYEVVINKGTDRECMVGPMYERSEPGVTKTKFPDILRRNEHCFYEDELAEAEKVAKQFEAYYKEVKELRAKKKK